MEQKTAVLIFANSSGEDQLQKAVPKGAAVFDVLNSKILKTVERSGLPFTLFTEKEQRGATFGERFTNAVQEVFSRGYSNIISIGNDTPQLTSHQLLETATHLNKGRLVLGPSEDGGFYLLGISKSRFEASSFLNLPWQTSALYSAVTALLSGDPGVEVHRLCTLKDIDNLRDLEHFKDSFRLIPENLKKVIIELLQLKKEILSLYSISFSSRVNSSFYNKGSPVLSVLSS